MKRIMFVTGFAVFLVCLSANALADTLHLVDYGMKLTLPERWELKDLTGQYNDVEAEGWLPVAEATDSRGRANMVLYAKRARAGESLDELMRTVMPGRLAAYSVLYERGNIPVRERTEDAARTVGADTRAVVKYYRFYYDTPVVHERSAAFVYFRHEGFFFYLFVHNAEASAPLRWDVERNIIPGITPLNFRKARTL